MAESAALRRARLARDRATEIREKRRPGSMEEAAILDQAAAVEELMFHVERVADALEAANEGPGGGPPGRDREEAEPPRRSLMDRVLGR